MNEHINPVHSPCKACVFAKYEDNTQTDCFLGLIDKYRATNHIEIIEAYDEDKEFYIINGKKCSGYKEPNYFEYRKMADSSIEEKVAYVQNNLKLKYLAIIDCQNRTPQMLLDVLLKLGEANVKPEMIMPVTWSGNKHSMNDYWKDAIYKSKLGCKWKTKQLAHEGQDLIVTAHQVINLGAEHCNFVLCIKDDFTNVVEIINKANDIVYNQFRKFIILSNESKDTILFNKFVYKAALAGKGDIITEYDKYTII